MESEKLLNEFGSHIKKLRQAKGLSQEKLGFQSGLDRTYISGIERGKRNVSLVILFKLAGGLNLPANELVDFSLKK